MFVRFGSSVNGVCVEMDGGCLKFCLEYIYHFILLHIVSYITIYSCHCKELKKFEISNVSSAMEEKLKIENSYDTVLENSQKFHPFIIS